MQNGCLLELLVFEIGKVWATSGPECRVSGTNFIFSFVDILKKLETHEQHEVCKLYNLCINAFRVIRPFDFGHFRATLGTKCRVCGTTFIFNYVDVSMKLA